MSVNSSTVRRAASQRSLFIATADYATIISTLFTQFSGKVTGCFALDTCRFCKCESQLEKKQNGGCFHFQKNVNVYNACVKVPEVPVVWHTHKFKM